MELTHASFFSGVGGLDLGLERAGWRTVSFSEIDPYASAVLAERWPGVPNFGDITAIADRGGSGQQRESAGDFGPTSASDPEQYMGWDEARRASLWSGGFPCQDLSVAGRRAGLAGARSGLAFAFLDLVERHRPPAILLENVPGLLSSNAGRDLGALLGRLGEFGYWWAYRILDAQFFRVPQRRRRVFICALHAGAGFGADSAAAVLSVGARCDGHSAAGDEARTGTAASVEPGVDVVGTIDAHHGRKWGSHQWTDPGKGFLRFGQETDSGGVREADGLAGRLDDSPGLAATLNSGGNDGGFRTEPGEHLVAYRKAARVNADPDSPESWVDDGLANTLNNFDVGDVRTTHAVVGGVGVVSLPDAMLPLGLDSHRYRCCGNGVVAPVSEWIGWRLRWAVEAMRAAA